MTMVASLILLAISYSGEDFGSMIYVFFPLILVCFSLSYVIPGGGLVFPVKPSEFLWGDLALEGGGNYTNFFKWTTDVRAN